MKIPKKIRILGRDFKIILSKKITERKSKNGKDIPLNGYVCLDNSTIWIDSGVSKDQRMSTLLHEIIEALVLLLDMSVCHDDIERLEVGLFQVLTENKMLK
jgi:hypothetical protein